MLDQVAKKVTTPEGSQVYRCLIPLTDTLENLEKELSFEPASEPAGGYIPPRLHKELLALLPRFERGHATQDPEAIERRVQGLPRVTVGPRHPFPSHDPAACEVSDLARLAIQSYALPASEVVKYLSTCAPAFSSEELADIVAAVAGEEPVFEHDVLGKELDEKHAEHLAHQAELARLAVEFKAAGEVVNDQPCAARGLIATSMPYEGGHRLFVQKGGRIGHAVVDGRIYELHDASTWGCEVVPGEFAMQVARGQSVQVRIEAPEFVLPVQRKDYDRSYGAPSLRPVTGPLRDALTKNLASKLGDAAKTPVKEFAEDNTIDGAWRSESFDKVLATVGMMHIGLSDPAAHDFERVVAVGLRGLRIDPEIVLEKILPLIGGSAPLAYRDPDLLMAKFKQIADGRGAFPCAPDGHYSAPSFSDEVRLAKLGNDPWKVAIRPFLDAEKSFSEEIVRFLKSRGLAPEGSETNPHVHSRIARLFERAGFSKKEAKDDQGVRRKAFVR